MVAIFQDSGHPFFRASSALDRGFLKKKGRTMYDSLQYGFFERRAFISHNQLCKSVQRRQSNRGLVWWTDSANTWSNIFKHGEFRCESEWAVMSKIGAWGSEYVGTNTWDECSSRERSTAYPSIRQSYQVRWKYLRYVNRLDSCRKFLLDNTSEAFTMSMMVLEERQGHAESIRYLVTTKILNLLGGFVDIGKSVQFIRSESYVNWDTSTVHVERRILFLDCDIQRPMTKMTSPENDEMVSATSVEQSRIITSSIEETHASKSQAQSSLIELPFHRVHPNRQKEVEWHSSLWYCRQEFSWLENLEKTDSTCTTSRHWCSKNWRSSSLEFFVLKATTWFPKWRSSKFLWCSITGLYPQRKQQTQVSTLRKLEQQASCIFASSNVTQEESWLLLNRRIMS